MAAMGGGVTTTELVAAVGKTSELVRAQNGAVSLALGFIQRGVGTGHQIVPLLLSSHSRDPRRARLTFGGQ